MVSLTEAISTQQMTNALLDTVKRSEIKEQPISKVASTSLDNLQMSLQVSETSATDQTMILEIPKSDERLATVKVTDLRPTAQIESLILLQQSQPFEQVEDVEREALAEFVTHNSMNVCGQQTMMNEQILTHFKPVEHTSTADLILAQSSAGIQQLALESESVLSRPEVKTESVQPKHEISNALNISQNHQLDSSTVLEVEKRKHRTAKRSLDKKLSKPVVVSLVQHDENVSTLPIDQLEQNQADVDLEFEQSLQVQQLQTAEFEQQFHPERLRSRHAIFKPLMFKSRSLSVERVSPLMKEHSFKTTEPTRRRASVSFIRRRALQNSSQQTLDSQDSETPIEQSVSRTASVSYTDLRAIQIMGASKLEKETLFDQPQQIYDRLLPLIHLRPSERIQHFYHHSSMFNVPSTLGKC